VLYERSRSLKYLYILAFVRLRETGAFPSRPGIDAEEKERERERMTEWRREEEAKSRLRRPLRPHC